MRVAAASVLLLALAASPAPRAAADAGTASDRSARIAALEQAVERDRERLLDLVATPTPEGAPPLRENPELLEIGKRLPGLQQQLAALRDERAASAPPPSPR